MINTNLTKTRYHNFFTYNIWNKINYFPYHKTSEYLCLTDNVTKTTMVGKATIKKLSWPILIGFIVFTTLFGIQLWETRFDYDFEKFFPIEDDETAFFYDHRAKFESDNDFLLIAIENEEGIFQLPFLKKVDRYVNELKKNKLIESITVITDQKQFFLLPTGLTAEKPYISFKEDQLKSDSTSIYNSKELINTLVSKNGKSLCLFIKHQEYISKKKCDLLIDDVNRISKKYNFESIHVAGRIVGQSYYIDVMNKELLFYVALSAILIVLFLYVAFRSLWGILIPQVILLGSVIWIVGAMGLFNQPINIILTTLPTVMFVVAMSDVIHLVARYLDALRVTNNTIESIQIALGEVGFSMFLTSITTAIGFFSLYFVNVEPIRIYGVVLGFGVLIAFVLTIVTLPALFYIFPNPKYILEKKESQFWVKKLRKWFIIVLKKRKQVILISILGLIVGVIGLLQIKTNNYLMDDMRADEPIKQDFNFLDENYGGIRPFEMAIILKDTTKTFWDEDVLLEIEKVENYIENKYGAEIKQSLVQTIKIMNRSSHAGISSYYELPTSKRTLRSFKQKLRFAGRGELYKLLVDSTGTVSRINGGIGDLGGTIIRSRNKEMQAFLANLPSNKWLEFKLTGTSHLLDKNMNYLSTSLVKGLLFSILIVALIMGLVYRSWSILIISIIPNLIPLVLVAGIMGYFGIALKTSTAIIFTIAFGIAVDDTIHFLGKFKTELNKGRTKIYALKRSYITTGKAMILTTLILCAGFLLLLMSDFLGTFYMGLLLCLTLFFALILDLTLLPVLLYLFYNPKKRAAKK